MPKSRHSPAICSPSSNRATNFRRSSMGLHAFQGILRSPAKAPLCYPCPRNEVSPFSHEGQGDQLFSPALCQYQRHHPPYTRDVAVAHRTNIPSRGSQSRPEAERRMSVHDILDDELNLDVLQIVVGGVVLGVIAQRQIEPVK